MKINVLEYFIVLAQSSSISEAAQKLYISQPSLTKALKLMETEIGVRLFERNTTGIILTPAGEHILPQAKQIMEYYNEWLNWGNENTLEAIHIFVGRSFPDLVFQSILLEFRKKYPNVLFHFTVTPNPAIDISRSTRNPVVALLICNDQALQEYSRLQGNSPTILMKGDVRCLMNRRNPLAGMEQVSLADLKNFFLTLPGSSVGADNDYNTNASVLCDIMRIISPRKVLHVADLTNTLRQIAENPQAYTAAFYPALRRYEQVKSGELVSIPFQGYSESMSLCLFYSRPACRQHPLMAEFITRTCEAFEQLAVELGEE